MKALVVGDTHGDTKFHEKVMQTARRKEAQVIIQLGDWDLRMRKQFRRPAIEWLDEDEDRRYYWLDGNHDNHDYIRDVILDSAHEVIEEWSAEPVEEVEAWMYPIAHWHDRMYYCPRGSTTLLGTTIVMFLGGAYSIDKDRRTPGLDYWPQETISFRDAQNAVANSSDFDIDIMFTHDCPDTVWFNGELEKGNYKIDHASAQNRELLTQVVRAVAPKKLYHGHYHTSYAADTVTSKGYPCEVHGLAANVRHNPHQFIGPIMGANVLMIDL